MSAVISVVQNCGENYAGYSQEVAKSISYLLSIDNCTANKNDNPIEIPSIGTNYSYETWIRLRCDLAPNNYINNIKVWYDSGMPASGYLLTVNDNAINTYQKPVNLVSSQGNRVDFTTKNSEENSIILSGTLSDVGDYTSYLVFQVEVLSTAEPGGYGVDYLIQYDEY